MKKYIGIILFAVFGLQSCANRDGEIIEILQAMQRQNEGLKVQISTLQNSANSALATLNKISLTQIATDKKLEVLQTDLKSVLNQLANISAQMAVANANTADLKVKLDTLQVQCAELVKKVEALGLPIILSDDDSYLPNYLPQSGLVAWYPFNGNANDESGNGNNGTINGATLISDRLNNNNKAYTFDGQNDFIQSSFKGVLGGNKRTLSFWAKTSSSKITDGMAAVSYGPNGVGSRFDGFFNFNEIGVTANIGGAAITYKSPSRVNDNKWHHYIFMIDNINPVLSSIKVFQDGILLNVILSAYNNPQIPVNTLGGAPLVIGKCNYVGIPAYFFGDLDDIAIWNRALTTEEISKIYKGEKF
jgi:hypothetical protein